MSNEQVNSILSLLNSFKDDNAAQHDQIIKRLDYTNGNVTKNTEFRLKFEGGTTTLKFILGFVGFANILILIKLFS